MRRREKVLSCSAMGEITMIEQAAVDALVAGVRDEAVSDVGRHAARMLVVARQCRQLGRPATAMTLAGEVVDVCLADDLAHGTTRHCRLARQAATLHDALWRECFPGESRGSLDRWVARRYTHHYFDAMLRRDEALWESHLEWDAIPSCDPGERP